MDVNNINCGDWLFDKRSKKNVMVMAINTYDNNIIVKRNDKEKHYGIKYDDLDYIPLSLSFFTSNGFNLSHNNIGHYVLITDENTVITAIPNDDEKLFTIIINTENIDSIAIDIKYLHEFQHILKMFNIDLEYKVGKDLSKKNTKIFVKKWDDVNASIRKKVSSFNTPEKYVSLMKLEILRDIYRNGWKPDWTDMNIKYSLFFNGVDDMICNDKNSRDCHFLSFKDEESCNEFYDNFNEYFDKCKEFLY